MPTIDPIVDLTLNSLRRKLALAGDRVASLRRDLDAATAWRDEIAQQIIDLNHAQRADDGLAVPARGEPDAV